MANRRITVEFLGKDVSAGSTAAKVEQKFGKLGGRLDRVGQLAGRALAGGLVLGTAALYKAGQAAAADEAAASQLSQTLQKAAGASDTQVAATERWIAAQGKALGVADDELRPALARLAVATGDVGEAQSLASLAMDVSAGTGRDLSSVSLALAKAQQGNLSGLQRLGIATKDASGETKTLEQVTADLAKTYGGDAAAAADTVAGRQRKLAVAMSELGEKIGSAVLPAMQKLTDIGIRMVGWISQHTTLVGSLVAVLGGLATGLWAASVAMRAIATATKVWSAVTKIAAGVQWALNAAMTANPIGLVIAAIAALVVGLVIAYKKSETFRNIVQGALRAVAAAGKWMWNSVLKPAFEGMKKGFQAVAAAGKWMWNNVLQPVFKFLVGAIATVMSGWAAMLRALSHVPGFGWAKSAADAMDKAAGKAREIGDAIQKIPARRDITIAYHYTGLQGEGSGPTRGRDGDTYSYARGTSYHPGGMAVVGERGPELVDLPRGARVFTAARSRGMMGGGPVVNINIGVATDPRATAREIRRLLLAEKRLSGANLGLA